MVEALQHIDCTCGTRRQNYDLISDMQLYKTSFSRSIIPGLEMLEKTGTHNMQHWPHHIPTILQPWRIDFWILSPSIVKLHDLDFTDRHKTSITRMSMPSGLNGKDTKHLKDANFRVSNYKSLSRPQKFIKGATINMLQIRNTVF